LNISLLAIVGFLVICTTQAIAQAPPPGSGFTALIQATSSQAPPGSFTFTGLGTVTNMPDDCTYEITIKYMNKPVNGAASPIGTAVVVRGANGKLGTPQYQANIPYTASPTRPITPKVGTKFWVEVTLKGNINTVPVTPFNWGTVNSAELVP
jgi:hypothetical protein